MSRRHLAIGVILGLLASCSAGELRAGFDELARHLPDRPDTVILFKVDEILASPLAVKEGWAAKEQQAFAANWIVVPPGTMRYAGAAQLELASMQPVWQAGVAELQFEPSMAKAAALHGGSVDEISGRSVAALPPDLYVVQFGKQLAGFMRPANRQDAGRWIDEVYSDSNRMPISPYNPKLSLALQGQQSAQIRTEERIRGNTSANLIMQVLQAETGEIRKRMTEKYQVEF